MFTRGLTAPPPPIQTPKSIKKGARFKFEQVEHNFYHERREREVADGKKDLLFLERESLKERCESKPMFDCL